MDFSALSDDQLVELIRSACAEAVNRNQAVAGAARAAMLSEAERAQIAWQAAASEADRIRQDEARRVAEAAAEEVRRQAEATARAGKEAEQNKLWGRRKALALMVQGTLGRGWELTVWQRNLETRVYIDHGGYKGDGKVSYYHTGNHRNRPGSIETKGCPKGAKAELLLICQKAAAQWNSLSMDCDEAADAAVPAAWEPTKEWVDAKASRDAIEAEEREKAEEGKRRADEEKAREAAERQEQIVSATAAVAPYGQIIATHRQNSRLLVVRDGQVALLRADQVRLNDNTRIFQVCPDPVLAEHTTDPGAWPDAVLAEFPDSKPAWSYKTTSDRERLLGFAAYEPAETIFCGSALQNGWSWSAKRETK